MSPFPPTPNPPVPEPPPEISRRKLWITLLIPPLVAGVGTPLLWFVNIVFVAIAIIVCLSGFIEVVRVRYRGSSLTFLGFAYFLGQVMICLVIGFGTCLVTFNGHL